MDKIDRDGDDFVSEEELRDWISSNQHRYVIDDANDQWSKLKTSEDEPLTLRWEEYNYGTYGDLGSDKADENDEDDNDNNDGVSPCCQEHELCVDVLFLLVPCAHPCPYWFSAPLHNFCFISFLLD